MMHWDALLGTWGLLLSYGLSALPLSYLYSFAFNGPSAAQISIAGVNFVSGFGFVVAYAVLVRRTEDVGAFGVWSLVFGGSLRRLVGKETCGMVWNRLSGLVGGVGG